MAKPANRLPVRAEPAAHLAAQAWQTLCPERGRPRRVTALKEKPHAASVYRLEAAGPSGTSVIAKRCRGASAAAERAVYEQVLPSFTLPSLRYYGALEEASGSFWWLFLEDGGPAEFVASNSTHRTLAAQWLGELHLFAGGLRAHVSLPERGSAYYLEKVRSARETVLRAIEAPALPDRDVAVLEALAAHSQTLEARWRKVRLLFEHMPTTLVHGDLSGKNARVREADGSFLLFDWEHAGWGCPAPDLARIDHGAYGAVLRAGGLDLEAGELRKLATVGRVLWCLAAIPGEEASLTSAYPERALRKMHFYRDEVASALQTLGWTR